MYTQSLKIPAILYLLLCAVVSFSVFAVSDSDLSASVNNTLQKNPSTASADIKVTAIDGIVTLNGNVANNQQLDAIVETANSVSGVIDVDSNAVTINNKAQTSATQDTLITAKVKGAFIREKLFGDKTIDVTGISVTTQNSVVSLSGTADSKAQINNAISIAEKIKGVTKVQSTVTPKS